MNKKVNLLSFFFFIEAPDILRSFPLTDYEENIIFRKKNETSQPKRVRARMKLFMVIEQFNLRLSEFGDGVAPYGS